MGRARRSIMTPTAGASTWPGLAWDDAVLYELHVGAFTPEGSFAGAARKLDHLVELGVTAVEIMPVADFRGRWGWGYDGVYPYAPDATYGRPEDFKSFVDAAHSRGVAVLLDVVYNHFGPEGNYLSSYAPDFFTSASSDALGRRHQFRRHERAPGSRLRDRERGILDRRVPPRRAAPRRGAFDQGRQPSRHPRRARRSPPVALRPDRSISCSRTRTTSRSGCVRYQRKPLLYTAQWNDDVHHVLHVAATHEESSYYADYGDTKLLGQGAGRGLRLSGRGLAHRGSSDAAGRARTSRPAPSSRSFRTTTRSATAPSASG